MSEPVTNVEIEDVLSSIRKLVSDGDKARTRDPAPAPTPEVAPEDRLAQQVKEATARLGEPKTDKLVLTPALMVVDSDPAEAPVAKTPQPAPEAPVQAEDVYDDDDVHNDDAATPAAHSEPDAEEPDQEPVQLSDMVWDEQEPASAQEDPPAVDRSELVATIAELEAAIATGAEEYEPDGSELAAETIEWPSPAARSFDDIEDAETAEESSFEDVAPAEEAGFEQAEPEAASQEDAAFEDAPQPEDTPEVGALEDDDQAFEFVHHSRETLDAPADVDAAASSQTDAVADVYEDDDLDDLLDDGAAALDQDALRALVAQVVREELTGPLGEKITRNVRKLVRREIYRILASKEFD